MSKGIKETKEALVLGFAIAGLLKSHLVDGFQPADVLKIVEGALTPEFVAQVKAGVEGLNEVSAEAGDIDLFEGLELAKFAIAELKKLAA
jgi:hypothetical protein